MFKHRINTITVVFVALMLAMAVAVSVHAQRSSIEPQPAQAEAKDPGWPRVLEKDGQRVVIYQPQVDSWDDYRKIAFRAAVEVTLKDETKATFGVIEVKADTKVDPDTRMVQAENIQREIRFPNADEAQAAKLVAIVSEASPKRQSIGVALDRVLAYMDKQQAAEREAKISLDPPAIFFSDKPAILALYRGAPEFKPVPNTKLMFAVNANWDILMDTTEAKYYLLNKDSWMVAPDPIKGPWQAAGALPAEFSKMPDTDEWKDVRANIPGKPAAALPAVFVSDKPAEIIVADGEIKYSPIVGTKLMYVSNTENPLFLCNTDGNHYFLVAGRWFRAKTLQGPWEAATQSLPEEFAKIPEDSPRASVLTSVPKTDAAEDAVLLASVPHKATVNRADTKIEVAYDGEPAFATIKNTNVKCAINTPDDVFEVKGQYYCCKDGVWFTTMKPQGPWLVCTQVPEEIYTIPPESPKYNVTYVYVYDSTPETVDVGYTAGYMGEYVAPGGLLVYGAGLALGYALAHDMYSDWDEKWDSHWDRWQDYQYHRPCYSYGTGAVYNPYYGGYYGGYGAVAGRYGGAAYAYGPYRGAARVATYNPVTGTYSRGAYRYGPGGDAYARTAYNPYTNTAAARVGGSNVYGSWGRTAITRDDEWIRGGHQSTAAGTTGWAQTSRGGAAAGTTVGANKFVAKTAGDDVYAGRDGNVYRRQDGEWQKYDNGGWNDANRPTRPSESTARGQTGSGAVNRPSQLPLNQGVARGSGVSTNDVRSDLSFNQQARQRGNTRANEYQRARSSPQPAQSYRPSASRSNYSRPNPGVSRSASTRSSGGSRSGGGGGRGRR